MGHYWGQLASRLNNRRQMRVARTSPALHLGPGMRQEGCLPSAGCLPWAKSITSLGLLGGLAVHGSAAFLLKGAAPGEDEPWGMHIA